MAEVTNASEASLKRLYKNRKSIYTDLINGKGFGYLTRKYRVGSMSIRNMLREYKPYIEDILGTASSDTEIYRSYIASKAPDAKTTEEEVADLGVDEVTEKGMTIFAKQDGKPHLWNYQIKGFFKNSCGVLKKCSDMKSSKVKAYKKEIDGLVFIKERKIFLNMKGELGVLQRPLRAQTAQGERIALAISETAPAGTTVEFTVMVLKDDLMPIVEEWLDYGKYNGLGQWHNASWGSFLWEKLDEAGNTVGGNYADYIEDYRELIA